MRFIDLALWGICLACAAGVALMFSHIAAYWIPNFTVDGLIDHANDYLEAIGLGD